MKSRRRARVLLAASSGLAAATLFGACSSPPCACYALPGVRVSGYSCEPVPCADLASTPDLLPPAEDLAVPSEDLAEPGDGGLE